METLIFEPVTPPADPLLPRPLPDDRGIPLALMAETYGLRRDEDGCLIAERQCDPRLLTTGEFVARLHIRQVAGDCELVLIAAARSVQVNGRRPFRLAIIQPGDLLSIEDATWMLVKLWRPEPADAPPELAGKPCPVCGGALGLAPVVRHTCGRWYHFQRPDAPDDVDALNCYLAAGSCSGCSAPLTMEPVAIPDVAGRFAAFLADGWSA